MTRSERRIAMISGASRGIGAAIAGELIASGWTVSLGLRRPGTLRSDLQGETTHVYRFDALEGGSEDRWVAQTIADLGRIDAVVNNAGISVRKTVVEASDEELDTVLGINVKSPLRLTRAAWPHLCASGQGRVVTIASLSGKRIKSPEAGLYAVSKFAAVGLAHGFRKAGFHHGVRSTAIYPGFVGTDMSRAIAEVEPEAMTQPEDVARIVRTVIELPNMASVSELADTAESMPRHTRPMLSENPSHLKASRAAARNLTLECREGADQLTRCASFSSMAAAICSTFSGQGPSPSVNTSAAALSRSAQVWQPRAPARPSTWLIAAARVRRSAEGSIR